MPDPTAAPPAAPVQGRTRLLWMAWGIWLFFLVPPILHLFQAPGSPLRRSVTLAGIAVFAVIYLEGTWRNARRLITPPSLVPGPPLDTRSAAWALGAALTALIALSMIVPLIGGPEFLDLFILTSAYTAARLPTMRAGLALAGLGPLVILIGLLSGAGWPGTIQALIYFCVVGFAVVSMVQGTLAARELRLAREEIARLAVTAERLRIARDLHDLLGHNLALITLKSELAGRLLKGAPDRAAVEIADIEQTARATLQQVRAALAGYRQSTLVSEREAAQQILAAAGIALRYEDGTTPETDLPPAVETVLSWAVREGVTNVVKHSRAHVCVIRATRDAQTASVEVTDDGAAEALAPDTAPGQGSGLRGLAERVQALGGHCEVGPYPGGFRLAVAIPLATGQATGSIER